MVGRWGALVRIAVSALLIGALLWQLDRSAIAEVLGRTSPFLVAIALLVAILVMLLFACRWHLLLRAVDVRLPFRTVASLTFVGHFFMQLLPTSIGGEAVKLYYGAKLTNRPLDITLTLIVDRAIGFAALVTVPWIALVGWPGEPRLLGVARAVYGLSLGMVMIGVALVGPGWSLLRSFRDRPWVARVHEGLTTFRRARRAMGIAFVVALVSHALNAVIYWVAAQGVGEVLPLRAFVAFVPLVFLPGLLPISIGGLGIREWSFVYLFAELGMPQSSAAAVALLVLVINLLLGAAGAAAYAMRGR